MCVCVCVCVRVQSGREHYPSARHHAPWGIPRDRREIQSVVSIEVHPLQSQRSNPQAKRRHEKGEQADWRHAGQIFSEMLGQLCHPELYSLPTTEYQEVLPPSLPLINAILGVCNSCSTYSHSFILC